jgi:hypothetical protein
MTSHNHRNQLSQAEPDSEMPPIHAQILCQTPGRIRMRVAHPHRQKHKIDPIERSLNEKLGIYRVRTNIGSGSITVFHAKEQIDSESMVAILRDLGILFLDLTEVAAIPTPGHSEAAVEVTKAMVDLNQRVKRITNGAIDLRFLLPLSLGSLAVRQLLIRGLQLDLIPWYVLAWYAFDSFIKLHDTTAIAATRPRSQIDDTQSREIPRSRSNQSC